MNANHIQYYYDGDTYFIEDKTNGSWVSYKDGNPHFIEEETISYWKLFAKEIKVRLDKIEDNLNIVFLEAINKNTFKELKIFDAPENILNYHPYPTLFFCVDSIDDKDNHEILGIPRSFRFLDDSIWCHYVCISSSGWDQILEKKIEKIKFNYENRLYYKNISLEYIELHSRLIKESTLRHMDGHGVHISPFLFHSETKMERRLKDKINDNIHLFNKNLKWRILLIDDYAQKGLKEGKEDSDKSTKQKIIESCIESLEIDNINLNNFLIDTAVDLTEAEEKMQKRGYDIILLDYLLGQSSNEHRREYSYELLEGIAKPEKLPLKRRVLYKQIQNNRPLGKFYFMYISAFTTAVRERLQEQGLGYSNEFWHLGGGACPTNTPELFKYNFLLLIIRQLKQLSETVKDEKEGTFTIPDLVSKIYLTKDLNTTRVNAGEYFNAVLLLRKKHSDLQKFCNRNVCALTIKDIDDKKCREMCISLENSSKNICTCTPLIYTLFPDLQKYNPAFWEHFMHLVYLTAYGTIRQWPEMWEEYLFIRKELKDDVVEVNGEGTSHKKKLTDCIEEHIIELKTNSF